MEFLGAGLELPKQGAFQIQGVGAGQLVLAGVAKQGRQQLPVTIGVTAKETFLPGLKSKALAGGIDVSEKFVPGGRLEHLPRRTAAPRLVTTHTQWSVIAAKTRPGSVAEVAHTREHHREAQTIRRRDHFRIAHTAAGLDECRRAALR